MVKALKILFILSLLFFPVQSFSAETVKFRYVQSVYLDEKGGGLKQPEGVACDAKSNLVVGDTGNDRLLRYTFQEKSLKAGIEIKDPPIIKSYWGSNQFQGRDFCPGWQETPNYTTKSRGKHLRAMWMRRACHPLLPSFRGALR